MTKIYEIEFVEYTNSMQDTVRNDENGKYINVGKEAFLIKEDEIEYYKKFGKGIRSLEFVGNLADKSDEIC